MVQYIEIEIEIERVYNNLDKYTTISAQRMAGLDFLLPEQSNGVSYNLPASKLIQEADESVRLTHEQGSRPVYKHAGGPPPDGPRTIRRPSWHLWPNQYHYPITDLLSLSL